MISKHLLFAGLTIMAGATLALQSVSNIKITSLPGDPNFNISQVQPNTLIALASKPRIPIAESVLNSAQNTAEIAQPRTEELVPLNPVSTALPKPIRSNTPERIYSALPFSVATTAATGATTPTPWRLTTIHSPTAQSGEPSTLIAVIDTGFALAHTSLSSRWWTNTKEMGPTLSEGPVPNCTSRGLVLDKSCNNIDNDGDGYPSDWRGYDFANNDNSPQAGSTAPFGTAVEHGTFVTGLIAGILTATSGGIDTNARIMPLQALTDSGSGSTTTVGDAILYAADHGAQIISLSLGTSSDDPYIHQTITYAISKGAIVVAAAGNDGCDCMLYPANYPEVISVGASTMTDTLASFSSYGANLDLIAPGQDLCSTTWNSANETTAYVCGGAGTSFATPLITGTISRLIASGAIKVLAGQYAGITADKLPPMNNSWRTDQYGTGRVDVAASLAAVAPTIHISVQNALIRTPCSGIYACAVTIATSTAIATYNSKALQGEAAAVYWDSSSSSSTPTLWMLTDANNGSTHYYSSV